MEPVQGVLREYKTAVEEGKRMRAAHVRSVLSGKCANRGESLGKLGRTCFQTPRKASEAPT